MVTGESLPPPMEVVLVDLGGFEGQLEPWEFGGGFLLYCHLL